MISARSASVQEKRSYEEARSRAEAGDRRHRPKTDATIDFSEMPEVVDWSGTEVGRFFRPTKRPVTMRLDDDVIEWLKSYGRGYQTKANLLLRHAMESNRRAAVKGRGAA